MPATGVGEQLLAQVLQRGQMAQICGRTPYCTADVWDGEARRR